MDLDPNFCQRKLSDGTQCQVPRTSGKDWCASHDPERYGLRVISTNGIAKHCDSTNKLPQRTSTRANRKKFLKAYRKHGVLVQAAEETGINPATHYRWMADPKYQADFAAAREEAIQRLEFTAVTRAHECSDTLLIFLLRALAPEKYLHASKVYIDKREHVTHTGTVGLRAERSDGVSIDEFPLELRKQMLEFIRAKQQAIEGKVLSDGTGKETVVDAGERSQGQGDGKAEGTGSEGARVAQPERDGAGA